MLGQIMSDGNSYPTVFINLILAVRIIKKLATILTAIINTVSCLSAGCVLCRMLGQIMSDGNSYPTVFINLILAVRIIKKLATILTAIINTVSCLSAGCVLCRMLGQIMSDGNSYPTVFINLILAVRIIKKLATILTAIINTVSCLSAGCVLCRMLGQIMSDGRYYPTVLFYSCCSILVTEESTTRATAPISTASSCRTCGINSFMFNKCMFSLC